MFRFLTLPPLVGLALLAAAMGLCAALLLGVDSALAQAVATESGKAVGTSTGGTVVTLPYGEYVAGIQSGLTTVMTLVITAVVAYLPLPLRWVVNAYGADKLAKDAVNIAIAATPGASKDAKLDVDVGSKVLAKALNYFIDTGAPRLVKAAGGVDALQNKLIGLIPLHSDVPVAQLKVAAAGDPGVIH